MTVTELIGRLADIGATVKAEGDRVAVRFPEERRRDVEELGPDIQRLKPQLMRELLVAPPESLDDIALALKVIALLEKLPDCRSLTISEITEAFYGRGYTLDQVTEVYRDCEELREARILIRARDGYGYQLSFVRTTRTVE